ncbi:MAG: CTP synthase [Candidatus Nomurabacteria bacterium]|jgi:CTP synthase|nr:CTP synthase [Candidatus Nomurabacteria bacterium]
MLKTNTKFIFVSGGVISGVGKGIMAASLGAILKSQGLKVSMQKCDPYLNVDAGQLNPREHGETFVTKDGAETDLDLGHYERFLDEEMTGDSTLTSGKLYKRLIDAERAGEFGGKTVQLVPHVTGLIQETFLKNAKNFKSDVHIVEIGGTVGDFEGLHFIEAIRAFPSRVGRDNCFFAHVCYVPWLSTSHEFKTKPAQNSLRDLREYGIIPDMVVARLDASRAVKAPEIARKLAIFCGIKEQAVVLMPNAKSVYLVPLNAVHGGALTALQSFIGGPDNTLENKKFIQKNMQNWQRLADQISSKPAQKVKVGLVAKYTDNTDTYLSVTEALKAAAWNENVDLDLIWLNAETVTPEDFANVDGLLVPGGFGARGSEGKIQAATYSLDHNKPYLGICLGLQVAVIAAARRAGIKDANSSEFASKKSTNVIYIMADQKGKENTGNSMRLGNYPASLIQGTLAAKLYGQREVIERHRHRYEVNQKYLKQIERGGIIVSGLSPDGKLVEFVEAPMATFFVATQAHPEFRSRPTRPHPLFTGFIRSLIKK